MNRSIWNQNQLRTTLPQGWREDTLRTVNKCLLICRYQTVKFPKFHLILWRMIRSSQGWTLIICRVHGFWARHHCLINKKWSKIGCRKDSRHWTRRKPWRRNTKEQCGVCKIGIPVWVQGRATWTPTLAVSTICKCLCLLEILDLDNCWHQAKKMIRASKKQHGIKRVNSLNKLYHLKLWILKKMRMMKWFFLPVLQEWWRNRRN